ncbi:MAG: hypothetical protein IIC61_01120 [Proteobacteria bacterium]|nr:hypothetical protein [Pseudomonadota bacterium]
MKLPNSIILATILVTACSNEPLETHADDLDTLVAEYLFLELSMGLHDSAHIDAYFGPEEIRANAESSALPLAVIELRAKAMANRLRNWPGEFADAKQSADAMQAARIDNLVQRLAALTTRIALNKGETFSFDEESRYLFGAAAPDHDAAHFEAILDDVNALLDGEGDLSVRVNRFRDQFVIPPDRLAAVFDAAIAECRRRTLLYIELPENESFRLEYVNDKPWSGYNWYQGNSQSLIQINTDLPIFISRAVDLGCHEGYPGHHTFNTLLEKNLVEDRGWIEFSLYPLFSPQSLIAEGSGNYGVDLAFPGSERVKFEKEILFPLAGLDPAEADRYYELLEIMSRLDYAGNEAARDYLNGTINREQAVQWLVDYSLSSPERARQRTDFFDSYRSYVINYNLGKDLVREYVERDTEDHAARWQKFEQLLSSPMSPADLQ